MELLKAGWDEPGDFTDFLQAGAGLDDATLLDAFAWQAVIDDGSVVVLLNCEAGNKKPAVLDVPLV